MLRFLTGSIGTKYCCFWVSDTWHLNREYNYIEQYTRIGIGIVRNPLFPHPLTKTPGSFWMGTISMMSVRAQYSISASQFKFKSLCP